MRNGNVQSKKPENKPRAFGLSYLVNEHPPWYLCTWLAFQVSKYNWTFVLLPLTTWSSIRLNILVTSVYLFFLTLFVIFSAFPNHAWINVGDSCHFTNSHVLSRQQTCHQWNPEHYLLCIWNCYFVADYVWCQVNTLFCCNFWILSTGKRTWSNGDRLLLRQC